MATYGQAYYAVLQTINQDYLGLSNLTALQHIENKIKCYNNFANDPHEYYECFINIERQREGDAKELMSSYSLTEEDFKLCSEGCKSKPSPHDKSCLSICNDRFTSSIRGIYDSFYRSRVGNRKEYKKAKN